MTTKNITELQAGDRIFIFGRSMTVTRRATISVLNPNHARLEADDGQHKISIGLPIATDVDIEE